MIPDPKTIAEGVTLLYRLIYLSSAARHLTQADLEQILTAVRRNNSSAGVSGLLLYHDDIFLQVLEGPEDKVLACIERIKADPRHHQLIEVFSAPVKERICSEWNMGYVSWKKAPEQAKEGFLNLRTLLDSEKMDEIRKDAYALNFVNSFISALR